MAAVGRPASVIFHVAHDFLFYRLEFVQKLGLVKSVEVLTVVAYIGRSSVSRTMDLLGTACFVAAGPVALLTAARHVTVGVCVVTGEKLASVEGRHGRRFCTR